MITFFEGKASRLTRHDGHAVSPLKQVEEGHESRDVKHAVTADGGQDQRNAKETRVGKGGAEMGDRVFPEEQAGTEDGHGKDHRRAQRAGQQAQHTLHRPLHDKAVDDDAGQRNVDQQIAQYLVAVRRNLAGAEQDVAHSRKQEHGQGLQHQSYNSIHSAAHSFPSA